MEFCDTFQRVQNGRVVYYLSAKLRAAGVRHGFSTRLGGVSTVPHLRQMNFGFLRGEDIEITRENYRIFACALGIDPARMVFTNQTHTTKVYLVGQQHAGVGVFTPPVYIPGSCKDDACNEVDGLVSGEKGLALGIRVADCVPVLLYDPVHGVAGAVHAGWRGTLGNICENALIQMEACGAMRQNMICAIGPAIGPCCYEVDADFAARFFERLGQGLCHGLFVACENGKYYCDLKTLNARLLCASGVPQAQIDVSTCCTACDPHLFFSHRATQGKRGTMGAVIEVPENA